MGILANFLRRVPLLCEKGGSFALGKGKTGGLTAILTENEERKKRQPLGSKQKSAIDIGLIHSFHAVILTGKLTAYFCFLIQKL